MTTPLDCGAEEAAKTSSSGSGGSSGAATDPDGKVMETIARYLAEGAESMLDSLTRFWMEIDVEDTGPTEQILGELDWIVGYVAVASLLIAAFRMAVDRKGQPMQAAFSGLWRIILVSTVVVTVVQSLVKASDAYAVYIFDAATPGEGTPRGMGEVLGMGSLVDLAEDNPGLVVILGIVIMLAAFVQMVLMIIRTGVLVMLVGTLPLAAAASMSGWGTGWWKRHIGWLAAWLLYKPAAALIFYCARLMTDAEDEIVQAVSGLTMIILGVLALPALLKLVLPAAQSLGGSGGDTAGLGSGQTLATGAVTLAGGAAAGAGVAAAGRTSSGPKGSPSSGSGAPPGVRGGSAKDGSGKDGSGKDGSGDARTDGDGSGGGSGTDGRGAGPEGPGRTQGRSGPPTGGGSASPDDGRASVTA
ncbi:MULTISPECIES: hypothetical protein [Streptomyces]|uniref:Integral membrane protein n=1 Tax=Streptomyces lycii TaxID=2654337 RepID=A0ABQ7FND6_9ACTN|nr:MULTISPECIES: hypothetical protein [Streptomyces]KAF4410148.1 hypothetical protein GCU69_05400 [Streptomyces lycii]